MLVAGPGVDPGGLRLWACAGCRATRNNECAPLFGLIPVNRIALAHSQLLVHVVRELISWQIQQDSNLHPRFWRPRSYQLDDGPVVRGVGFEPTCSGFQARPGTNSGDPLLT